MSAATRTIETWHCAGRKSTGLYKDVRALSAVLDSIRGGSSLFRTIWTSMISRQSNSRQMRRIQNGRLHILTSTLSTIIYWSSIYLVTMIRQWSACSRICPASIRRPSQLTIRKSWKSSPDLNHSVWRKSRLAVKQARSAFLNSVRVLCARCWKKQNRTHSRNLSRFPDCPTGRMYGWAMRRNWSKMEPASCPT